jgi:Bifunctional DNA primase/polymerase, N-terminal/Primase C terminal 1 (PriCT-1)
MTDRQGDLLAAALAYAARGWKVFPLHTPAEGASCSCVAGRNCERVGKHPRTLNGLSDATDDQDQVRKWWGAWPTSNIGIRTGAESGLVVIDVDERHAGEDTLQTLRELYGQIPVTVCALTGGGLHYYFKHPGVEVQSSTGRIGDGIDCRGEGGYVVAPPSLHAGGRLYAWEGSGDPTEGVELAELPAWLLGLAQRRATPRNKPDAVDPSAKATEGGRNKYLAAMAGRMVRAGFPESSILTALLDLNERRCVPTLDPVEVRRTASSVARYTPGDPVVPGDGDFPRVQRLQHVRPAFPTTPDNPALRGLAGDFVRTLDPFTEADPAAVLAHLLVFFGNLIGPGPHFRIGGDRHAAKLFAVLVGDSAYGRKGTSESLVRSIFEGVSAHWARTCIVQGLASGEGLIRVFEDPNLQGIPKEPRATIVEPELVNVLKAMGRDGSTLSGTIRNAWDRDELSIVRSTKKNTLRVAGVHVSMMAHITQPELVRSLDSSQNSNGFANRFLWFEVGRSKEDPDGKAVPGELYNALVRELLEAQDFAESVLEVTRTPEASELWRTMYGRLTTPGKGLAGLVTSRAAAYVLRLAMIYALLDRKKEIAPEHLESADALFSWTNLCARSIFGGRMGDPIAQRVVEELRATEGNRMTRADLYDAFGRNISGMALETALRRLQADNVLDILQLDRPEGQKGRPTWIIQLTEE